MHPFKGHSEHRHGRSVAKKRGYQSGGSVADDPSETINRPSSQSGQNQLGSPLRLFEKRMAPYTAPLPSSRRGQPMLRRPRSEDMPMAKGGAVSSNKAGKRGKSDVIQDKSMIRKAMKEHDKQLHGGKRTELKLRGGGRIGGADSGVGRMEKAQEAAKNRGKR